MLILNNRNHIMRLLIIGRLSSELIQASKIAMSRGASVTHADGIEQGLSVLRAKGADLIMVDVLLSIRSMVESLEAERIRTPLIACGTGTDARAAVAAIQAGAREYIPLPPDPELIAAVIEAMAADPRSFVWRDPAMERVVKLADQVARSDASILITGESGTGKEVMARYLHQKSSRKDKPFICVNCAAIPDALLESELFGHEKGAFTGASARRIGKFEEAHGGTLLLDEISEMEVRLQAKLLRALQERVIDRVGGSKPVPVDIRILATSNRLLADEVKKGTFREDLLYRLNVMHLRIPSLRERPKDILELATHFVRKYAQVNGLPDRPLSQEAQALIMKTSWQGNVRELENTMHRAVLLASGGEIGTGAVMTPEGESFAPVLDATTRAVYSAEAVTRSLVGRTVADVERDLIVDTLGHCLGNRTHAAKILGISIRTLRNKLNEYVDQGVDVPEPGQGRVMG
jgi:two-component system, response regulator FlrC